MRDRRVQAAATVGLLVACSGPLFTFDVSESDTVQVERGTLLETLVSDLGFDFLDADIQVSQALANQGVAPGDVDGVRFTELVLTVTAPAGGDLSFMTSLEFFVSGQDLPLQRVAFAQDFPVGQGTVRLSLEDVDLTAYVVAESMDIITDVAGRRPSADTTIEASYTIEIGATRQGACNQLKKD